MKKQFFLIAAAIAFAFTSCHEDEYENNPDPFVPDGQYSLMGSWYEEAENEEFRVHSNGTFYDRYCNPTRSVETEGRWEYDSNNHKFTETFTFLGQVQFADFTVKNLTETSFTLSSSKVADHKFERIVETYTLNVGGTAKIQFPTSDYKNSYTVTSYESQNPYLASVNESGEIVATGEKGTTYIKVKTDKGNVWVKVLVGDDCLDLWYDYSNLLGKDYNEMKTLLGIPAESADYIYLYYCDSFNDYVTYVVLFMDESTNKINEIQLNLKDTNPATIQSYMESHYYPCEKISYMDYQSSVDFNSSRSVVKYDKENNKIVFIDATYLQVHQELSLLPDYTDAFGMTKDEIVAVFGELTYGMALYDIDETYFSSIYFNIDAATNKVTAYQLFTKADVDADIIKGLLSKKYNCYKTDETNTMFAYRDGDSQETSNVMLVYNAAKGTVICFDLNNYGKSANAKPRSVMFGSEFEEATLLKK